MNNKKRNMRSKLATKSIYIYYIVLAILYLYLVGMLIYKLTNSYKIDNFCLELILILVLSVVFGIGIFSKNNRKKNRFRLKLSKLSKKKRVERYCGEAILISLSMTTIIFSLISFDIIFVNFYSIIPSNATLAIILMALLFIVIILIVSFFVDYICSELWIKKHYKVI